MMNKGINYFNKEVKTVIAICENDGHNLDFVETLESFKEKYRMKDYYTALDHLNQYLVMRPISWFIGIALKLIILELFLVFTTRV